MKNPLLEKSPYHRKVKGLWLDAYDVIQAWGLKNAAIDHALKKLLGGGDRGHKNLLQDIDEAIWSLQRAKELISSSAEEPETEDK